MALKILFSDKSHCNNLILVMPQNGRIDQLGVLEIEHFE
jgi:hypothetical protein